MALHLSDQPHEMTLGWWKYFKGPKGVAVYMSRPNTVGSYNVYFFRAAGKGKKSGTPEMYKRVTRLDTQRKTKGKAMNRAYIMAYGRERKPSKGLTLPAVNSPMTAYCMKEKKHVEVESWQQITAKNGRLMLQSVCPTCSTKVSKYGKLIDCPECGKTNPVKPNDYLCAVCRETL
jgi:hypothetical protein